MDAGQIETEMVGTIERMQKARIKLADYGAWLREAMSDPKLTKKRQRIIADLNARREIAQKDLSDAMTYLEGLSVIDKANERRLGPATAIVCLILGGVGYGLAALLYRLF